MPTTYSILSYNQHDMEFLESTSLDNILAQVKPDRVSWITLSGITLVDDHVAIKALLDHFHLNPLLLDTIFSRGQQQLEDDFDDCLYLEYSILLYRPSRRAHAKVKGCMILGPQFLLLFEKMPSGLFEKTRGRIIGKHTKAQNFGADYLLYLLVKTIVLNYQKILKALTVKFEVLEDEVIGHPGRDEVYDRILDLRDEFKPLHSYLIDLTDIIDTVQEEESALISKETQSAFTKMLDHDAKELVASDQYLRTWIVELIEIHRANVNENTNRVMKTLTIISTIFLPLTFIAGVYGMNFDFMPELREEWGYPAVIALMLVIAGGTLLFLRIRRWL